MGKKKTIPSSPSTSTVVAEAPQRTTSNNGEGQGDEIRLKLDEHSRVLETLKDVPQMLLELKQRFDSQDNFAQMASDDEGQLSDVSDDNLESLLNGLNAKDSSKIEGKQDDSLMEILEDSEHAIEYGEKATDKVAESFGKCTTRPVSKETYEKLKNVMKPPENCKQLVAPRINNEIWSVLPNTTRTSDYKLQQIQTSVSQGLTALLRIADCVTVNSSSIPSAIAEEILRLAVNGGNLLGMGFQEISSRRRSDVRPSLNQEYAGICSSRFPVTEYLFGDNLSENLKASKTASSLVKKSSRYRPKPYGRSPAFQRKNNLNFSRPSLTSYSKYKRGGQSQYHNRPINPNQSKPGQKF